MSDNKFNGQDNYGDQVQNEDNPNQLQGKNDEIQKQNSIIEQNQTNDDDLAEIKVSIIDPQLKDNKYVIYKIVGEDREGQIDMYRRYSHFDLLHDILVKRWPSVYIYPIPPKKVLNNKDQVFINERRKGLEVFIKDISNRPYIWYSEEFQCFLRQQGDVEILLKDYPALNNDQLVQRYIEAFRKLDGREITGDVLVKINSFKEYLNQILPMLENYKSIVQNIYESRENYNDQFQMLFTYLLPEYEKNYVMVYDNQFKSVLQDDQVENQLSELKQCTLVNQFESLQMNIQSEIDEIRAFQVAMKKKDEFDVAKQKAVNNKRQYELDLNKVMAGQKKIKKTQEESIDYLNTQIAVANKDIENLSFLCDIFNVLLGYTEIDNFKQCKQIQYFKMLQLVSQLEIIYCQERIKMYQSISHNV